MDGLAAGSFLGGSLTSVGPALCMSLVTCCIPLGKLITRIGSVRDLHQANLPRVGHGKEDHGG